MRTWQESQAHLVTGAAMMLACSLEAMPADRLEWVPDVPGAVDLRPALALVSECVHTNTAIAGILTGAAPPENSENRGITDSADGAAQIRESATLVASAILGLTEADLDKVYQTYFAAMPGRILLTVPMTNMMYHNGQLNMLQLLYGDPESHFPDFG